MCAEITRVPAPEATPDYYTTPHNTPLNVTAAASILLNDTASRPGAVLRVINITGGQRRWGRAPPAPFRCLSAHLWWLHRGLSTHITASPPNNPPPTPVDVPSSDGNLTSVDLTTGSFVFTPRRGFTGNTTFTYGAGWPLTTGMRVRPASARRV